MSQADQQPATLAQVVRRRAMTGGGDAAYTFLDGGARDARTITWAQLDQRAAAIAARLQSTGATGKPVLLALGSGLGFVESLFGCWYAGAIAVPVSLPRHQRVKHRLDGIMADAGADFAIGTSETRFRLGDSPGVTALTWIDAEKVPAATFPSLAEPSGDSLALLQYTSGSTGMPSGVMVTHSNLMHNSGMIARACGHAPGQTIAGWLPLFHDMGLVGLVLQAAYSGARCVFMSPERFLMRPRLWLQMISDYSACSSPAPNFAYDLCVERIEPAQRAGLNLSGWRNALNGSEPVRAETLQRFAAAFEPCGFSRRAFFPCYGLAEATLFVTGPGEDRRFVRRNANRLALDENQPGGHVGCGNVHGDLKLQIVDPVTSQPVASGGIGEIWLSSASVAAGYWKQPVESPAVFNARLAGGSAGWLRTGDLGFVADGELFITGRLREMIIFAGRNHFPIDIERTVETTDPAINSSGAAAFSIELHGVERWVIIAELRREHSHAASATAPPATSAPAETSAIDPQAIIRRIRAAVTAEHEVSVHDIVLVQSGALMRTTSGKVSRLKNRESYLSGHLVQTHGEIFATVNP